MVLSDVRSFTFLFYYLLPKKSKSQPRETYPFNPRLRQSGRVIITATVITIISHRHRRCRHRRPEL